MRDLEKYRGVIPAFYACYDEEGEISAERTEAPVSYTHLYRRQEAAGTS